MTWGRRVALRTSLQVPFTFVNESNSLMVKQSLGVCLDQEDVVVAESYCSHDIGNVRKSGSPTTLWLVYLHPKLHDDPETRIVIRASSAQTAVL